MNYAVKRAKAKASRLATRLNQLGVTLQRTHALEAIAAVADFADWNTYRAHLESTEYAATAPWLFNRDFKAKIFVGDTGSGLSDNLCDIARQAMGKGKTVLFFSMSGDMGVHARLYSSAVAAGVEGKYFVNSFLVNQNPSRDMHAGIERPPWHRILLSPGSVVCTLFPALSKAPDEIRAMASGHLMALIAAIEDPIVSKNDVVVLVDHTSHIGPMSLARLIQFAGSGAEIIIGMHGDQFARDAESYLTTAKLFLLRSNVGAITGQLQQAGFSVTPDALAELQVGEGYEVDVKNKTLRPTTYPIHPPPYPEVIGFVNQRVAGHQ